MKNKSIIILFACLCAIIGLKVCASTEYFGNQYSLANIDRAEVADFTSENYKQIDCHKFIDIIKHSKTEIWKFVPYKTVNLYSDKDTVYSLSLSKEYKCFKVNEKSFGLSKKQSKQIAKLLE